MESIKFITFINFRNYSDGVYEVLGYHDHRITSNYNTENFISDLKERTQFNWFKKATWGDWQSNYKVPISTTLTRHGYCFTFNMQPAESLLNLDKYECKQRVFKYTHKNIFFQSFKGFSLF